MRKFLFGMFMVCGFSMVSLANNFYVGADVGHQSIRTREQVTSAAFFLSQPYYGDGANFGIHAGYDWIVMPQLHLALQLAVDFATTKVNSSTVVTNPVGVVIFNDNATQKLKNSYAIEFVPGYDVFSQTRLYGDVGWRRARFESTHTVTGFAPVTIKNSRSGFEFGGGLKIMLNKNFAINGQYLYTMYRHYSFANPLAGTITSESPRVGTFTVGVEYNVA